MRVGRILICDRITNKDSLLLLFLPVPVLECTGGHLIQSPWALAPCTTVGFLLLFHALSPPPFSSCNKTTNHHPPFPAAITPPFAAVIKIAPFPAVTKQQIMHNAQPNQENMRVRTLRRRESARARVIRGKVCVFGRVEVEGRRVCVCVHGGGGGGGGGGEGGCLYS